MDRTLVQVLSSLRRFEWAVKNRRVAFGKSLSTLIREILMEYSRGVLNTLDRISALVKALEVQLLSVGIARIDTQREREKLYEIALDRFGTISRAQTRSRTGPIT